MGDVVDVVSVAFSASPNTGADLAAIGCGGLITSGESGSAFAAEASKPKQSIAILNISIRAKTHGFVDGHNTDAGTFHRTTSLFSNGPHLTPTAKFEAL
jgi:hypothetical protein